MSQPPWLVTVLVGAIVGYLFPHLISFVAYLVRRSRRDLVEGTWHVYHITGAGGESHVESAIWVIRKGLSSKFVIDERRGEPKDLMYKGVLKFERNFWLVTLQGIKHQEEVLIRLFNLLPTGEPVTWGLYFALDSAGNPMAGPLMISREEVSTGDVVKFLTDKAKISVKMKLLTAS